MKPRLSKEEIITQIKFEVARVLNVLRLNTLKSYFSKPELEVELNLPTVKKNYIISELIRDGVIINAGRNIANEKTYWFKDSKIPIVAKELTSTITNALSKYEYNTSGYKKEKLKDKSKSKENDEMILPDLNLVFNSDLALNGDLCTKDEQECIKFLLKTGKYKIQRLKTEWVDVILN